jgi:hypothetical protein
MGSALKPSERKYFGQSDAREVRAVAGRDADLDGHISCLCCCTERVQRAALSRHRTSCSGKQKSAIDGRWGCPCFGVQRES